MAVTPSDFTLIGHCPQFNEGCDYTTNSIEENIREHLKKYYQIDDIEYVNVSQDIHGVYEVLEKLELNMKYKALLEDFLKDHGFNENNRDNIDK